MPVIFGSSAYVVEFVASPQIRRPFACGVTSHVLKF